MADRADVQRLEVSGEIASPAQLERRGSQSADPGSLTVCDAVRMAQKSTGTHEGTDSCRTAEMADDSARMVRDAAEATR